MRGALRAICIARLSMPHPHSDAVLTDLRPPTMEPRPDVERCVQPRRRSVRASMQRPGYGPRTSVLGCVVPNPLPLTAKTRWRGADQSPPCIPFLWRQSMDSQGMQSRL